MLWAQRKKRKTARESSGVRSSESCRGNDSWIKSHFSRLSEERLPTHHYASYNGPSCENRQVEASTTIHMDTFTSTHGEGGMALHRDSFASKHKVSGTSVTKETQRESGKTSSMDNETWAEVAACAKDIDAKGHHLANSMLKRAKVYQRGGHVESKDISPEELKALEEVEIKLKGNFLAHRESTVAGANQTRTVYSQCRHGHQNQHSYSNHQSNQNHPVHASLLSHQGYSSHPSRQSHPGHSSHQCHPDHSSHQSQSSHSNHQSQSSHSNYQGLPGHSSSQSHQGQPGHTSHQSHSLPSRSQQIYDS
uniref:RIKEN cDNA 4933411K16 gene n=1 Tax=Cricetulus griseus TaxID=10029 RepID=A0A8C2LRX6_CRIGR